MILGTPFGGWFKYARELRGDLSQETQRRFTSLHDELYVSADHEAEALPSLTTVPTTNLPEFRNSIREFFAETHPTNGVTILTDTRLICTAGVIAAEISTANFLIFIESPRAMLARTLDKADPSQLIEDWILTEELEETFLQKQQAEKDLETGRSTFEAEKGGLKAKIEKLEKASEEKEGTGAVEPARRGPEGGRGHGG